MKIQKACTDLFLFLKQVLYCLANFFEFELMFLLFILPPTMMLDALRLFSNLICMQILAFWPQKLIHKKLLI